MFVLQAMVILIEWPWLALAPAAVLLAVWRLARSRLALAAAVLWALYAGYEYMMHFRVLCTGECNIRLDLILLYPLLLVLTLGALAHGAWRRTRSGMDTSTLNSASSPCRRRG
jgi:hypothetical protein